ncbi:MAG: hypothetical protein NZM27_01705 [Acetobacteraceae bacterium]|nr:hypothetical protein [Acetobacteraceae bacterium]MCX7686300.1 hypothetical protein [Acetobacteraceae bacterium]MDW8397800.1 hypothetical protein [Acetobacteraceae bacterium]
MAMPPARAWRGLSLLFFLLPLVPAALINLLSGQIRQLLGTLLGLGLGFLAFRMLRRGGPRRETAAVALVGVATGLAAGLAANLHPVGALLLGLGAAWGAKLAYTDPKPAAAIEGVAAPPPDPLEAAAPRIAALARSAPRLPVPKVAEAAEALGALMVELRARPNRPEDARRFLLVMLDGLERIAARLAAGAEPPPTLPALLEDMIEGAGDMRRRLREAETLALDVQVKVLSDRLRQEGLA